jgi:glycine/betaine/sarcosine/D-proline reductase family selenoprotein B
LERAGLPTAVITCLYTLAEGVGAHRIVAGKAIPYPVGDPNRSPEEEKKLRKQMVQAAVDVLKTKVGKPTVFEPSMDA